MKYRYDIKHGVQKIKTKSTYIYRGLGLSLAGLAVAIALPLGAHAASNVYVSSSPTTTGTGSCSAPNFNTISGAVAVATSGEIIIVCPGTYTEDVTINTPLTLEGAQHGVDARTRSGTKSTISGNVTVNADNVTVDGFTISNSTAADISMEGASLTGENILNNIINAPHAAVSYNTSNTTISKNLINLTSTSYTGVQANNDPFTNITVSDNTFTGSAPNADADINFIGSRSAAVPTTPSGTITVTGNASNNTSGTLVAAFQLTGLTISNNTALNEPGSVIYLGGGVHNANITDNNFSGDAYGIVVDQYSDDTGTWPANSGITANRNNLANDTDGMYVGASAITDATVDGTCNYWGAANGPSGTGSGNGSLVTPLVDYAPWLTSSDLNGSCIGGNIVNNKDQCKDGGWQNLTDNRGNTFKNQGDCVSFVATGGKNPGSN